MSGRFSYRFYSSLFDIPFNNTSNGLASFKSDDRPTPFNTLAFLNILESSESIGGNTGWLPHYFVVFDNTDAPTNGNPCAVVPMFEKSHSYGEYVFDHAWANAFYQHGLDYYPKLLCALPFTPVSSGKLLIDNNTTADPEELWAFTLSSLKSELANYSSIHFLFMPDARAEYLEKNGYHLRRNIQFIFYNRGFASFDDFLSALKSRKRKSITKERRQIQASGIVVERLTGESLSDEIIDEFYECYKRTYLKRSGHTGYLTKQFFKLLKSSMLQKIMIVKASKDAQLIASALFFYDDDGLYGRYWGALEEVSGLHFECCYYQGIEFAIDNKLQVFNPGTQGEHKILRGFTPTYCYSAHKLHRQDFDAAVADFTRREASHIEQYMKETTSLLPFKVE